MLFYIILFCIMIFCLFNILKDKKLLFPLRSDVAPFNPDTNFISKIYYGHEIYTGWFRFNVDRNWNKILQYRKTSWWKDIDIYKYKMWCFDAYEPVFDWKCQETTENLSDCERCIRSWFHDGMYLNELFKEYLDMRNKKINPNDRYLQDYLNRFREYYNKKMAARVNEYKVEEERRIEYRKQKEELAKKTHVVY